MNRRTLGKTGYEVSVLGFGAAPAAYLKSEEIAAARMIEGLLDQGINLIDTAISYPGSHAFIGNHLSHRRDDFVLVSKCGGKISESTGAAWSEEVILAAVDSALRNLKTDHLDVMLLHSCDLAILKAGTAIGSLVKAREAGKVRFVGYSGDNDAAVFAANHSEVAVIETSINVVEFNNIDVVLPACRENNVGVIAKRPIANACWKDVNQQPGMYRNYAASYTDRLSKMGITPGDLGFDGDPAEVWPRIALRFTLGQPGVTTAIVGTTNPANASKNMAAADEGPLSAAAVERLRAAFEKADPQAQWIGLT